MEHGFLGRVFQLLGLPVNVEEPDSEEPVYTLRHEYTGLELETVRRVIQQPDFKYKLAGVIKVSLIKCEHPQSSDASVWAENAIERFIEWFRDPAVVAVASDVCTQYFGLTVDRLNYEV